MLYEVHKNVPNIHKDAWVAKHSDVIGNVSIEESASIFFRCVIRGDKDQIIIKKGSNIQDGCILHTDEGHKLVIDEGVSVGHGCILHGCHIEQECLIGMGAILLNDVRIGKHCIIGAGTLLLEGTTIPPNSVVVGNPGKVIKQITAKQIEDIRHNKENYIALAKMYKESEGV